MAGSRRTSRRLPVCMFGPVDEHRAAAPGKGAESISGGRQGNHVQSSLTERGEVVLQTSRRFSRAPEQKRKTGFCSAAAVQAAGRSPVYLTVCRSAVQTADEERICILDSLGYTQTLRRGRCRAGSGAVSDPFHSVGEWPRLSSGRTIVIPDGSGESRGAVRAGLKEEKSPHGAALYWCTCSGRSETGRRLKWSRGYLL